MSQTHCNTSTHYRHLSSFERGQIYRLLKLNFSIREIARQLGRSPSTISREIKRGSVTQLVYHNGYQRDENVYFPEVGERVYQTNREKSGRNPLLSRLKAFFLSLVAALKQKYRVHRVLTFILSYRREHPHEKVPCFKTVYRYIHQGLLPCVLLDLPRAVRYRKRKPTRTLPTNHRSDHRSISNRPEEIKSRTTFGHWEIDLMIGKNKKEEPVLLTLVERKTRYLIAQKLSDKNVPL